ncbi:ribonuclease inhibitor-like [Hoplias malabaricus]|uniref:ribonuclease inhibitor-like n=1 Tax=Hoplias malabaricus TaxID=27720 RepID=UPI003461B025
MPHTELNALLGAVYLVVYFQLETQQDSGQMDKGVKTAPEIPPLHRIKKEVLFVLLSGCKPTKNSCETLCSVLKSPNSPLKELEFSETELQDSGVELISEALKSSHCKLETLRCYKWRAVIREESLGLEVHFSDLKSPNSSLKELDLSHTLLHESEVKLISDGLKSSNSKVEILRLSLFKLSLNSYESLCSVLKSPNSPLKELDLSHIDLQDSGVKLISETLKSSHCKLETLRLTDCRFTLNSYESLCSALNSPNSPLKEPDLSQTDLQDSGVKLVSEGWRSSHFHFSALKSPNSSLKELDLSDTELQESEMKLISDRLKSSNSKVEILRLSRRELSMDFYNSLCSALKSPNSPLKELDLEPDLSQTDLQDSGVKLVSEGWRSSHCTLEIIR